MTEMSFQFTFKKGVCGKDNEYYFYNLLPECTDCHYDIPKGKVYYYWAYKDFDDLSLVEDGEYILCNKCALKRKKK
jgi:hypothetical protein